jgi:calcineurin-like phosphoesterase family protein
MNVFFSSDFHIGHNVISPKYRSQFSTSDEHHEFMLDKLANVWKNDILYILGDFLFDCDKYDYYISQIGKMRLRIKLILGNHDSKRLYDSSRPKNIELENPLVTYKKMWLSHCPIHPNEIRGRLLNLHGHLHNEVLNDSRYFNVCLDQHNFEFITLETIKEIANKNG